MPEIVLLFPEVDLVYENHSIATNGSAAHTHTPPIKLHIDMNRAGWQMIDKVTVTIKTLQCFHWDRLLLLLLFSLLMLFLTL